jgi:hypothetical protein
MMLTGQSSNTVEDLKAWGGDPSLHRKPASAVLESCFPDGGRSYQKQRHGVCKMCAGITDGRVLTRRPQKWWEMG